MRLLDAILAEMNLAGSECLPNWILGKSLGDCQQGYFGWISTCPVSGSGYPIADFLESLGYFRHAPSISDQLC